MTELAPSADLNDFLKKIKDQKEPLNKQDAQLLINEILHASAELMKMCYLLDVKEGYKALEYDNFKECIQTELKGIVNYDYATKLKNAGYTHALVCPELSMGEVPPGRFRPLQSLSDEDKQRVWNTAKESITPGQNGIPSSASIKSALNRLGLKTPSSRSDQPENSANNVISTQELDSMGRFSAIAGLMFEEIANSFLEVKSTSLTQAKFDQVLTRILEIVGKEISRRYKSLLDQSQSQTQNANPETIS